MSTKTSSFERAWEDASAQRPDYEPATSIFGVEITARQLDLLADENGKMPNNVFALARKRGVGKPKGSIKKATKDLAAYLINRNGSPVEFMSDVRSMALDQGTRLLMEAEGYSEREKKLFSLIDKVEELHLQALREDWSEAKLELLDRMAQRIEKAAASMKSKPGDLALKFLTLQLTAANNEARYVHSAMPVQVAVDHRVDGTIVGFVAPGQGDIGPVGEVMKRIGDAVQAGAIDAAQVLDIRVVDGEYRFPDDDGDDA